MASGSAAGSSVIASSCRVLSVSDVSRASIDRKPENRPARCSTFSTGADGASGSEIGTGADSGRARCRLGSVPAELSATALGGRQASVVVSSARSGRVGASRGGRTIGPVSGRSLRESPATERRRRGMPTDVVPSVSESRSTGTAAGGSGSTTPLKVPVGVYAEPDGCGSATGATVGAPAAGRTAGVCVVGASCSGYCSAGYCSAGYCSAAGV
ncbi:hypothetical protein ISCU110981_19850 [Isoptericola cucumis]